MSITLQEAQEAGSGAFTTVTPIGGRGVFLKAVNDGSEFLEVVSLGTAAYSSFGHCTPQAPKMRSPCLGLLLAASLFVATATDSAQPARRLGVAPVDAWTCPISHPIKGNLTTRTGECIYHVRGGAFYDKTKPELCFANEDAARQAGCRRSKR